MSWMTGTWNSLNLSISGKQNWIPQCFLFLFHIADMLRYAGQGLWSIRASKTDPTNAMSWMERRREPKGCPMSIKMCQDVSRCVKMCQDVSRCVKMCQDVSRCVKMCQDVSRCVKMPAKTPLDFQFETLQSVLKHELSRIWYFGSRQDLNYQDAVKFGLKSGEVGQNMGRWLEQSICFCQKYLWISAIFEASWSPSAVPDAGARHPSVSYSSFQRLPSRRHLAVREISRWVGRRTHIAIHSPRYKKPSKAIKSHQKPLYD